MKEIKVLIVDDEPGIRRTLTQVMEDEGWFAKAVSDSKECLKELKEQEYDVVILDVLLPKPGKNGIEILREIKLRYPYIPVIMISGHSTIKEAIEAIRLGAFDFIEKPLSLEKLIIIIKNAVEKKRLQEENIRLRESLKGDMLFIGESALSRNVKESIRNIAENEKPVLIFGDSGSGKRIVARLIHENSKRRHKPFNELSVLSTPEEIIEEELFGKISGNKIYAGKIEISEGGTLYISEVHLLKKTLQNKLLDFLRTGAFERKGDSKRITADVRLIFASTIPHTKIEEKGLIIKEIIAEVGDNKIRVPSLKERKEDIPLLIEHFLINFSNEYGYEPKYFSDSAMRYLSQYNWPGNVRELKNFVERIVIKSEREEIREEDVKRVLEDIKTTEALELITRPYRNLKEAIENFEREFILYRFKRNNGDIKKTAAELKIPESTLIQKINYYSINIKNND